MSCLGWWGYLLRFGSSFEECCGGWWLGWLRFWCAGGFKEAHLSDWVRVSAMGIGAGWWPLFWLGWLGTRWGSEVGASRVLWGR